MKIILATAIKEINNLAEFIYNDEDINTITWLNNTQPIANNIILAKQAELQALQDVVDKRIKEYGSIVEQIEYITENGLDAWQTKVNTIKTKYPKE
jgi:hypothetical protein